MKKDKGRATYSTYLTKRFIYTPSQKFLDRTKYNESELKDMMDKLNGDPSSF